MRTIVHVREDEAEQAAMLKDLRIREVSGVRHPANGVEGWAVLKQRECNDPNCTVCPPMEMTKADAEAQYFDTIAGLVMAGLDEHKGDHAWLYRCASLLEAGANYARAACQIEAATQEPVQDEPTTYAAEPATKARIVTPKAALSVVMKSLAKSRGSSFLPGETLAIHKRTLRGG